MKNVKSFLTLSVILVLFIFLAGQLCAQDDTVLARVEVKSALAEVNMPIYAHIQDAAARDYALVMVPATQLASTGFTYEILDYPNKKAAQEFYYIALERRRGARQQARSLVNVLHDDGRHVIVRTTEEKAEALAMLGFDIELLSDTPLVLRREQGQFSAVTFNPTVSEIINKVQQNTLFNYVGGLSGEQAVVIGGSNYTIRSRYTKSGEPITKATQYAYEFLEKLGLTVSYHDWQTWSSSCRNVIANKTGTGSPKEIVLVTAHFDSVPSSATNSPGADDNGSGSVGLLLAAEILSQYQFDRTVRFALFTGEEQGLLGSGAYATKVSQDGDNIVAVYNMDMISWDSTGEPTLRLHTRTTSNSGYAADKAIATVFTDVVSTYKISLAPILDPDGITASDHSSFWRKGYAGILSIEDDADDFCQHYHTSSDKRSTLNMTYFTNYVKAIVGTIAHLAVPNQ